MKMEKIYPNADLKLVSKVILYAGYDEGENFIFFYWDPECTKMAFGEELFPVLKEGFCWVQRYSDTYQANTFAMIEYFTEPHKDSGFNNATVIRCYYDGDGYPIPMTMDDYQKMIEEPGPLPPM